MADTKIVTLDVQSNLEQSAKSAGNLKSQLREAQLEVATLSEKFGATSREAVEAAKRAGELKDRIGDAKALTDAFNPDAKFKAVSASLAGVAGGFSAVTGAMGVLGVESESVQQQILKVQSAMAIASGLQQLGESADAFRQMKAVAIDAFKGIKAAIGSTGIGLLVVALGAIYTYWDDIKAAVSGVSEEQKKLNSISQANVDQANEKLKAIGAQDNILKLQGKSEKDILAIKIKQTDESIAATKINIANQIQTNKLSEIGAKRNYEYLKSFIDMVSLPQRLIFEYGAKAINKLIDILNKVPGIDIKAKIDEKFGDKAADYITKLAFDPEKTKAEGDATVKASQDSLNKLLNDRAGYKLASNAIDKTAADEKAKIAADADKTAKDEADKKAEQKKKDDEEEYERQQKALKDRNEAELKSLDEVDKAKKAVEDRGKTEQQLALEAELTAYELKKANALQFGQDIEAIEQQHKNNVNDINEAAAKKNEEIATKEKEAKLAQMGAVGNALQGLSQIAGEETAAGKALAIAAATINTYKGISEVWAAKTMGNPVVDMAVKIASTAIVAAQGIANVSKIMSVKVPGASGGGGGGSVPTPAAAPSFNVVGNSGTNQIAQVMNNQGMPPVQAYVVASNVTSAQSLNRNIVNNATLG